MECKKGWVAGRVQGVGFRYFVQRCAEPAGLTGYARNLPDGRVEVLLQGPTSRVQQVMQQVRQGPPHARVDDVVWQEVECLPLPDFTTG